MAWRTLLREGDPYLKKASDIGMAARVITLPEHSAEDSATAAISELLKNGARFDAVLAPIDAITPVLCMR